MIFHTTPAQLLAISLIPVRGHGLRNASALAFLINNEELFHIFLANLSY